MAIMMTIKTAVETNGSLRKRIYLDDARTGRRPVRHI